MGEGLESKHHVEMLNAVAEAASKILVGLESVATSIDGLATAIRDKEFPSDIGLEVNEGLNAIATAIQNYTPE